MLCQAWAGVSKRFCQRATQAAAIGVREGILLGGAKIALKITICPETNFFSLIRMGPETSVNLFYTVKFVYKGFVCDVNSPTMLHFVIRSRWHLLHTPD